MTTTDRVSKVLERVAREAHIAWRDDADDTPRAELFERVLESRLGPLLRAGQAMRRVIGPRNSRDWDACLAALEREGQ